MTLIRRRRALMGAAKKSQLPAEFQQVEWIGRDSTNTGYLMLEPLRVGEILTLKTKQTDLFASAEASFAGPGRSGGTGSWEVSYTKAEIKVWKPAITKVVTITYGSIFDETVLELQNNTSFAYGVYRSESSYPFYGRMFEVTVVLNGDASHNYIPCYRKADNVIGMYDTIGKNFYSSANSGTFTKGANV